ncbi:MAG: hypothetical protein QOG65_3377 [Actinomycetota bacterium]|jgi:hypothetical protein|nr:hypothetical protein [Actinomycetota bacterium]MDQ1385998.1 hypothetical protein [Actinomycetota bacterium]
MTGAIRVMPWPDPVLDAIGHDPRSWYVETFWLPTLGPTALLLLRHLADRFETSPKGVDLPVAETAAALGLGPREGQHSPLIRSLTRLQQFELACSDGDVTIAVRKTLPPVHRRHVRRLPSGLQARHAEWIEEQATKPVDIARRRARRFALTLLVQDEPLDAVERALHASGFHPALAHEAVRWAREQAVILNDGSGSAPLPEAS